MPFRKGQSGNPGGCPKEVAEIKALARRHGPAAIQKLVEHLESDDGKLSQAAAIALLDRGYGKPGQSMDLVVASKSHEEWLAALDEHDSQR
jgi:HEAT repeat protein